MENLQERLKERFYYYNGNLFYKSGNSKCYACQPAGSLHHSGRLVLKFENKQWLVHRLIFMFHNGYLPSQIDHIDGNSLNNKIENLRPCDSSQNQANTNKRPISTNGYKGVCRVKWEGIFNGKWKAKVVKDGINYNLGTFATEIEAAEAYNKKAIELHGEFARLNEI